MSQKRCEIEPCTLFLLYTTELFEIIASAGLVGHLYADGTQVYISAPAASESVSTQRFISCVERTDAWMRSNRLHENERRQDTAGVARNSTAACQADHHRAPTAFCPRQAFVRSDRLWRQHRRSSNHGRPRRRATPVVFVSTTGTPATGGQIFTDFGGREDAGSLIHAFVSISLNYCNSLLYGISDSLLTTSRLFRMQQRVS